MEDKTIVCRCSDVSLEEIREVINQGHHTFEEVKRILRTGMGPCQGRTCTPIILKEISNITGTPLEDLQPGKNRPPVNAVSLGSIVEQSEGEFDE